MAFAAVSLFCFYLQPICMLHFRSIKQFPWRLISRESCWCCYRLTKTAPEHEIQLASHHSKRKRQRKQWTESASSTRACQSNSSRRQVMRVNSRRVSSNTHTTEISHLGKPPTVCPFHSRLAALMDFFSPQRTTTQSSPTRKGQTRERKRHGQQLLWRDAGDKC